MSGFNGKWKRVSCTNIDDVIKAAGCDDIQGATMRALFADAEIIENYNVTAAGTHRELFLEGDLKRVIDSTFDTPQLVDTFFGKSTLTTTKVSDTCLELRETPTGGNRPGSFTSMSLEGGKIIMDYTINGVTCRRTYERI